MPRVVVRKAYRCRPGKRRDVLAALQRVDEAGAASGWPRGRYVFVETRAPGEPDLEVEFTFESYAEMERLERRLREHLARTAREVGGPAGQEQLLDLLLEPSATRYLLLLDSAVAEPRPAQAPGPRTEAPRPRVPVPEPGPVEPAPREVAPPEPAQTVAQRRARQLADARAAMESAERAAGLPAERRSSQRGVAPPGRPRPDEGEDEAPDEPDEALDASA
jgi:hypothetical protein